MLAAANAARYTNPMTRAQRRIAAQTRHEQRQQRQTKPSKTRKFKNYTELITLDLVVITVWCSRSPANTRTDAAQCRPRHRSCSGTSGIGRIWYRSDRLGRGENSRARIRTLLCGSTLRCRTLGNTCEIIIQHEMGNIPIVIQIQFTIHLYKFFKDRTNIHLQRFCRLYPAEYCPQPISYTNYKS